MPVNPIDRPIAALREETIDQLIVNYSHGELSLEAFERRLGQALDAETHEALLSLTEDLDLNVDKAFREKRRRELGFQMDAGDVKDVDYMVSIFGGTKRGSAWSVPKELWMINIFGGTELDFSEAQFSSQTTHIMVFCLFGGADLCVPAGVNTISKAICIFGGIDDRVPSSDAIDAPTLILEGFMLFGGISIKVKKAFRKRLLKFADTVKDMFSAGH